MTRWDNLHERYFNCLATLSFDKAKELLVCEKKSFEIVVYIIIYILGKRWQ